MKLHNENPVFMILQTSINHMMLYITTVGDRVSKIQDILRKQIGLITICKKIYTSHKHPEQISPPIMRCMGHNYKVDRSGLQI